SLYVARPAYAYDVRLSRRLAARWAASSDRTDRQPAYPPADRQCPGGDPGSNHPSLILIHPHHEHEASGDTFAGRLVVSAGAM
ncbi:MAG: hypothetical protein ACRELT_06980, partial [Longimicrobiales bacterium]